jgi:phytoene desaturase
MHAVPRALAAAAQKHGVEFKYNTTVTGLDKQNGRVKAVTTDTGERIECDVVVMNPDLPVVWRDLLGKTPLNIKRLNYSPSCATLLVGSSKKYDHIAHHNIHFGESWDGVFDELINKRVLMTDPSVLVTVPTHDDPSLAPAGKQSYYILYPTPNLDADIDWTKQAKPYRDQMITTLEERGYTGFGDAIETEVMTTPLDWQKQGMERGAPFASAHTFFQTGPFRPRNVAAGFENVVFAGSGTQPGVGVPMVLISGRLAAERIVGPVK